MRVERSVFFSCTAMDSNVRLTTRTTAPASLGDRGFTLSAEPQVGSRSSVRSEFGCL
jgi:hypothetical protein